MGQKTNVVTLRKFNPQLSLTCYNTQNFKDYYNFNLQFTRLLDLKGIWVDSNSMNTSSNIVKCSLVLYYKAVKVLSYRRRKFKAVESSLIFKKPHKKLGSLFSKYFQYFKKNLFLFTIINLNKKINKNMKKLIVHIFRHLHMLQTGHGLLKR